MKTPKKTTAMQPITESFDEDMMYKATSNIDAILLANNDSQETTQ